MSLFQCEKCGAKENTAMVAEFLGLDDSLFCSECRTGKWHDKNKKIMLPKGEFITDKHGNLVHKT